MKGAGEYAKFFHGEEQHGKLYIQRGSHARGATLHIWVLPSSEKLKGSIYNCKEAVEVYGITSGQPGWTETYGWLHNGKWQEDFQKIFELKKKKAEQSMKYLALRKEEKIKEMLLRTKKLLEKY